MKRQSKWLAILAMALSTTAVGLPDVRGHLAGGDRGTSGSGALSDAFTMVIMSDPQFFWGCRSENDTPSDYCRIPANQNKSTEVQGLETNRLHIDAIKAIRNGTGSDKFRGVVINGDLTSFGSQNRHLEFFEAMYMKMGITVWPGLGNHDYQNNVNPALFIPN